MTEEERAENETAKTGLKQSLDTADDLSKEMGALLPRLWVVFRKESVGMQATQLHFVTTQRAAYAQSELKGSILLGSIGSGYEPRTYEQQDGERLAEQRQVRYQLLKSFNSSIRKRRL